MTQMEPWRAEGYGIGLQVLLFWGFQSDGWIRRRVSGCPVSCCPVSFIGRYPAWVLGSMVEVEGQFLVFRRKAPMDDRPVPAVHRDPDIMGGTPVFVGTRVPFQTLLDYLEAGDPLGEFLDDFPSVSREQAVAALEQAKDALIARAHSA